ncbi:predicted protein [Nematostella vectensis]|uniref:Uncharacterized protein n=1 Tax=Nematostella vectensis TaxID=45351 RepID=A7SP41_NEMVE|nr:predicted protein [Nematostella vectensis]|eukprot:XP_001626643.1 predicted protein [Nematostella vectensis]
MSYYHQPSTAPLDNRLLHEHLDARAQATPDKEALIYFDENFDRKALTFSQFRYLSRCFARALLEMGIRRGDRIALMLPNGLECAVCCMALHRIGSMAVLVPLGDIKDSQITLLKKIKCRGVIRSLRIENKQAEQVQRATDGLLQVKGADGSAQIKVLITTDVDESLLDKDKVEKDKSYLEILELGKKLDCWTLDDAQSKVRPEDPVAVVFTSGSTGEPKAVTFTQHAIVNSMTTGSFKHDDRYFMARPIVWISGFTLLCAVPIAGFTLVMAPSEQLLAEKYEYAFKIIQGERCTSANLLQNLLYRLIDEKLYKKYILKSLRSFGVGGQRIPKNLISSVIDVLPGIRSLLVYGCTETLLVGLQPISKENVMTEDYGKMFVIPGVEIKVVDREGVVVPRGVIGEVCVRSPKAFLEYLDDPVATAGVKTSSGWVHTADLGMLDSRDRIQIFGRKRDSIKRSTRLVYPVEIERTMMNNPHVKQAIAFGIPDKNVNEEICACLVTKETGSLDVGELEAWCEEHFVSGPDGLSLKPKYFVFMDKFPQTGNGKDDRRTVKLQALGLFKQQRLYKDAGLIL